MMSVKIMIYLDKIHVIFDSSWTVDVRFKHVYLDGLFVVIAEVDTIGIDSVF